MTTSIVLSHLFPDELSPSEVLKAYELYSWPVPQGTPVKVFLASQIKKFDANNNEKLDQIEWAHFMEDLWRVSASAKEKVCSSQFSIGLCQRC